MAYVYTSRTERLSNNYRRVEALYRNGSTFEQIAISFDLSIIDVLDITQKIFALDQKKVEGRWKMPRET